MRTTYTFDRQQDNCGEAIEGCRDEAVSICFVADDTAGGAETLTELLDAFQRYAFAVGFTWCGDGNFRYVRAHEEIVPKGTMDRLTMAERDLQSRDENSHSEFPNGEFPNDGPAPKEQDRISDQELEAAFRNIYELGN